MGRAPSHVALECALHSQPNLTLIGEEIATRRMTLAEVVGEIADTVLYSREMAEPSTLTRTLTPTLALTPNPDPNPEP